MVRNAPGTVKPAFVAVVLIGSSIRPQSGREDKCDTHWHSRTRNIPEAHRSCDPHTVASTMHALDRSQKENRKQRRAAAKRSPLAGTRCADTEKRSFIPIRNVATCFAACEGLTSSRFDLIRLEQ
jgi:hypothetical protein